MLTPKYASRRFMALTCAALGPGNHRCLLNHTSPGSSPVARLSNEELLLIFEAALDDAFANAAALGQLQRQDILVTISHVCRRWRAIAISNSSLWKDISSCSLSIVQRHLSRSGTRPLNIYERFPARLANCGTSSGKDESIPIAAALAEEAHRWKTLLWIDSSANNATNVARLLQSSTAYSTLERLELSIPQCVPLKAGTDNASNAILFPALRHLSLTRVHPMVLPRSAMPALLTLKLNGLARTLSFSRLFYYLLGTPALRTLTMNDIFPTLDLHRLTNMGLSPPSLLPNGTLRVEGTRRVNLSTLDSLALRPAPARALWLLFHYLELPALAKLDLHVYTDPRFLHWPCISPDGRPVEIRLAPYEAGADILGPDHWTISLPALRSLHVTYYISPPPTQQGPAAPPPATLPQLHRLAFPGLTELQITHAIAHDSRAPATAQAKPSAPLLPLPAFDELFHAPDFRHLVRLALIGCVLPLATLCDTLRTRMPALEELTLRACPGAGALVCALAPGECGGGCERLPGDGDAWIGMKVHTLRLSKCPDVRGGCLRKVIEARLKASSASSDVASESGHDSISPRAASPESSGGQDLVTKVERPQRFAQMQIVECPGVSKDDIAALAAIPGARLLYCSPPRMAGIHPPLESRRLMFDRGISTGV